MIGRMAMAAAAVALAGAAQVGAAPAAADEFYKGRTVHLSIAAGAGGGFDTIARALAEYLPRHIPGNPTIVPQNRPGAGGRVLANWLYNAAEKDGSQIALLGPWTAFEPMWGVEGVQFDASKFNWLVSANREVSSCLFWRGRGAETFADLQKRTFRVGSYGVTSAMTQDAMALNALLGTKLEVVHGYKGTRDTMVAVERGELDGSCGIWASSAMSAYGEQIRRGDLKVVVQLGMTDHPDFEGVENPVKSVTDKDDRAALALIFGQLEIARPFAAPPGVPAERVAVLRKAFWDTLHDPELQASAKKRGLVFRPLEGEKVQTFVSELYDTPTPIVERAKKIMG